MARLYDHAGLVVSEDWIRTPTGQYAISDVRRVWVTRRQVSGGNRWLTAALAAGAVLIVIGGVGLTGWLTRNWLWLLASPVLLLLAGAVGLLDPLAIYLEKRHHELWITVGRAEGVGGSGSTASAGPVLVSKANAVELRKALRQIQRARQRHSDARLDG